MKADGSLKSLLQGVSQQPTRDRLPGQCTEQINMSSDPVKGLSRRPGDDLVGSLGTTPAVDWGVFKTKNGSKFIAKIVLGNLEVYDYAGTQYPVSINGSMDYWNTVGKWSITSIKGKTYLANNAIITRMRSEVATYINQGAGSRVASVIQVLGGGYGKTTSVIVDGVTVAAYTAPDGGETYHSKLVTTDFIAGVIEYLLVNTANGDTIPDFQSDPGGGSFFVGTAYFASGWTVSRSKDVILIQSNTTGVTLNLTVSDGSGNLNAKAMVDSVPDIADLPRIAPEGYVVRVAEATDPDEDLWFKFVTDGNYAVGTGFGTPGAWYETVAPDLSLGFDKATMPRVMDFNGSSFVVTEEDWADRTIGTDSTNPEPSFIGYGINDMANFQSRLVLLGGASLVGSRTKKYTNFWIGSASTLVDTDPIDLSSQAAEASSFRYCVPHNKDLVIFSEQGQFVMFGRTAATPSNAALVLTTSFETDLDARPSPCGRNVFFGTKYGRYTGVREFYTEGGTDINDTRPITQHVKEYLVGNVRHLTSTSNYDTLVVHTKDNARVLYPYQFIWSDNNKVQSSWSKWTFDDDVLYSFFDQEQFYYIINNSEGNFLVRMSLDVVEEVGITYHPHLSAKFDVIGVNTQFELPFEWLGKHKLLAVQGAGCPYPGLPVAITSVTGKIVTLREDMLGGSIIVGTDFLSKYKPTMPRVKDNSGDVVTSARLQINQFLVSTENTGSIAGYKESLWGTTDLVKFEGYVVNDINGIVGQAALTDYIFKMPFKDRADRADIVLQSDAHWPMTILDIEWSGTVNKRGRRIESKDNS